MKKVKITQEQADAIEEYKGRATGVYDFLHDLPLYILSPYHADIGKEQDDMMKMMSAYVNGYEVEPEFNVGDWVHVTWSNTKPTIHKVIKTGVKSIDGDEDGIEIDWESKRPPLRIIRHATPEEIAEEKERRFFSRNGREPWELAGGDILRANDGGYLVTVKAILPGGHPLFEGGKVYVDIENVKRDYKVACFYSDRKDVDNE